MHTKAEQGQELTGASPNSELHVDQKGKLHAAGLVKEMRKMEGEMRRRFRSLVNGRSKENTGSLPNWEKAASRQSIRIY
jgi:hypothetical protein